MNKIDEGADSLNRLRNYMTIEETSYKDGQYYHAIKLGDKEYLKREFAALDKLVKYSYSLESALYKACDMLADSDTSKRDELINRLVK